MPKNKDLSLNLNGHQFLLHLHLHLHASLLHLGLLFNLHRNRFLLDLHRAELVLVGFHTLDTHIEVTLLAVVELIEHPSAKKTIPLTLELGKFESMLVVAGIEFDGLAFKAVV